MTALHVGAGALHNPFSSERVEPGAIPFLSEGACVATAVLSQALSQRAVQIIGPHGSGKSTLLAHVAEIARARDLDVVHCRTNLPGSLPAGLALLDEADSPGGAIYRPLGLRRILARCRRSSCAVIVSTHADLDLPTAWSLSPNLPTVRRVVDNLLQGWPIAPPPDSVLLDLLERRQGNLRLVLFDLYDWFEESPDN
jgi:hypothetical protein